MLFYLNFVAKIMLQLFSFYSQGGTLKTKTQLFINMPLKTLWACFIIMEDIFTTFFEYHITLFAHMTLKTKKTTTHTNYHLCKIKLVIFEI